MNWNNLWFFRSQAYDECKKLLQARDTLPPSPLRALHLTPLESVKCVIVGQDPYHTRGMADGLAFSVSPHVKPLPPSLRNIFKEYQTDLGWPLPRNGNLEGWAREGVLLLNTVLTVQEGVPLSHVGKGWEKLTHEIIRTLSHRKKNLVFILWGKKAQEYRNAIDQDKHLIIEAVHPSPLSARKGFFGHRPFSRTNEYLERNQIPPIRWRLP